MKRRIAIIIVFLLFGAIVNVAVAWGCAMWGERLDVINVGMRFEPLPETGRWFREAPSHWPSPMERGLSRLRGRTLVSTTTTLATGWTIHFGQMVDQAGLPMRAMESEQRFELTAEHHLHKTVLGSAGEVPKRFVPTSHHGRYLPLRPIWRGFAINMLLYALLLWVLFIAPFAARRMLRRRRGLCAKCAYPVGSSPVCTECGAAVVRKAQA